MAYIIEIAQDRIDHYNWLHELATPMVAAIPQLTTNEIGDANPEELVAFMISPEGIAAWSTDLPDPFLAGDRDDLIVMVEDLMGWH